MCSSIQFASNSSSGAESFQQVDLIIILSQAIGVDVTVDYDITGGTALAGSDFVAASGQFTIPAGQTVDSLRFFVIDDSTPESNETVLATISNPVNATLGAIDQNTYTIFDDDAIGWVGPGGITNSVQNKLWYNAVFTPLADGSAVSLWEDLSGNNHDAIQGSASLQPVFRTNVLNSRPVVDFDGTDGLWIQDNTDVNTGGPYDKKTLSIAFRTGADVTTRQVLYEEGGTVRGLVMYIDAGTFYVAGWNYNNDDGGLTTPWPFIAVSTPIAANTPYLAGMEFNFDGVTGIGNVVGYMNGDTISILPGAGRLFAHSGDIGLGYEKNDTYFHDGPDGGDGFNFNGIIGEFINSLYIYNTAQKKILNNYYSSKWLIPVSNDLYAYDATHSWEVFGIGRDNINNSHTKSQGTGYVRIENPSSLGNGEFLLIGHDNAALTWTATNVPNNDVFINRLNRTWRTDQTTTGDGVGTVRFTVDINNFSAPPGGFTKYVVIIDSDNDFTSGATVRELTYDAGNDEYYATGVNLAGDYYFTIGVIQPTIEFTVTSAAGQENVSPVTVQARTNFVPSSNVTADLAKSGTASDGPDYSLGATQVLIPAGQQTGTVQLSIVNDALLESDETIILTMSNPSAGVVLGTNTVYTYTINDDDDLVEVQFSAPSVSNDESVLNYDIPVSLDVINGSNDVSVNYAVTGGTATNGSDFTLASGVLTIPSGSLNGVIPVVINDDGVFESDETFIVTLSNPVNANLGAQTTFTYTIEDNETPVE
ncbi:MAG: Calx-beta domain-containing protein, partial [Bacteroidales bacterium]